MDFAIFLMLQLLEWMDWMPGRSWLLPLFDDYFLLRGVTSKLHALTGYICIMNSRMNGARWMLLVGSVLFGTDVLTQSIITDRPDQTESATVIPSGSFQWECGAYVEWTEQWSSIERNALLPTSLFRIGLIPRLEFRVVQQIEQDHRFDTWTSTESASIAMGDIELGFKWQLLPLGQGKTQLALLSHAVLPNGSSWNRQLMTVNKICVSHDVGDEWALGYNVGCNVEAGELTYTYALAIGKAIDSRLSIYAEPFGSYDMNGVLESSIDAGFTWLASDHWQWDWSFGTGLNHHMNYTSIGFSWWVPKD